jgi:4-amino-4-deoxy-L-arabinose transferase-like glycosyltransferase
LLIAARARTDLRFTLLAGAGVGLVKTLVTLPFMTRYGWDRDELYFLAAAHHPALGYVDFPPVTAWIGWLVLHTAGASLLWLRMTGQVASAAGVVLAALIARDLGAGRLVQVVAAAAWATTPVALASASIYHPTIYDITAWVAISWVTLRLLQGGGTAWWVALGLLAGAGVEVKYTIVVYLAALAAALALSPQRRLLLGRGPLIATALGVLLTLPNILWQARNDWASAQFYPSQHAKTAGDTSHPAYVVDGALFLGAMSVVAVVGMVWLWRRGLRPLALAPPIVVAVFFVASGRAYYPLPAMALPIVAGTISVAAWVGRGRRRRWAAIAAIATAHVALVALVVPLTLPVLPTATMIHDGYWQGSFFKDEIGWGELTADTLHAWHGLPAIDRRNAVVLTQNYGEAGALAHFAAGRGLPPVVSGHLSWQYWGPVRPSARSALTVGFARSELRSICISWRPLVRVTNSWGIANEEAGRWIGYCRLAQPLGALWRPRIATYTL